ncbi:hypothetical protein, partial [Streptomyces sp. NPDC055140]
PKALKEHGGQLLANEWGEPLGAVVKKDSVENLPRMRSAYKFFFIDLDGNPLFPLDRKGAAQGDAIRREDRLSAKAPDGWRRSNWSQVEPGTVIRLPETALPETAEKGLSPENWSQPLTLTGMYRGADGSLTVEGTCDGQTVRREFSRVDALPGPLREAVGAWAVRPETVVVRAARPALLQALKYTQSGDGLRLPGSSLELADALDAIRSAEEALEARPTAIPALRKQIAAARDAAARLAADAERTGWPEVAKRAQAAHAVAQQWADAFEDVDSAAQRLQGTGTALASEPERAPEPTATVSSTDPQPAEQAQAGRPGTQMRREDFNSPAQATPDSGALPEGQLDLDDSDANPSRNHNQSAQETAEPDQGATGMAAEEGTQPDESATRDAPAQERPEDSPVSIYDAMRLGGQEVARALLARVTVGEFATDGQFLRARVLLDGEDIGSVVTRPDGGYAASTIENWTSRHPYETVSGAVAQVGQSYDEWVATGDEREARARELGLDQTPAAPEGELPEGATPVPGFPDYHQVSAYPGTVVYGPGNRTVGSVDNRTYNQGKHKTLYGDESPIKGQNTIERSVRHLVEVHAELNDVPTSQAWRRVWIEHHDDHTNVWGADDQYRELVFALEVAGGPRGFNPCNVDVAHRQHGMYQHAMPKNLTYETRTEKVNKLQALLSARGREIPVFETFEARQDAEAVDRAEAAATAPITPAREVGAGLADDAAPAVQQGRIAPVRRSSGQPPQGQAAHGMAIHAMDVDDLDATIEALRDATDPLSLAYRLRAERRRWALLRQEAEDWVPQPEYDAEGNLVEPSRGRILRERADGYRLSPNETTGAVTSVDDLLPAKPGGYTDTRWAEIEAAATTAEDYPPTPEQRISIEGAARRSLDLRVMALAGSGKSTLLKMLSRRMPGKRILLLAFNRSVADDAIEAQQRGEYSENLTPTTANSYANSMVDEALLPRLKWPKLNEQQLADRMRWRSRIRAGGESLSPQQAASLANRLLSEWVKSADDDFAVHHLPDSLSNRDAIFAAIRPLAQEMWDNLIDPKATNKDRDLPLSFDHPVKMWALSGRVPDTDVLFWDEAQDDNPVMESSLGKVRQARNQVDSVGDTNPPHNGFR